jgi:hypothetical protein
MAALGDAIRQANVRELDQNEVALASCFPLPAHELSDEMKALLVPYIRWCEIQRVRALPSRPTTIAAFLQGQKDRGIQPLETLLAIEALHLFAGYANPVATPVVRSMIEGAPVDPPRSWSKVEKEEHQLLPLHMQTVIARREQDRERSLRTSQNKLAEERKRLQADAETKSAETEKDTTMAKWNGPQGSKDMEKDPLTRDTSARDYPEPKDIESRVNKAQTVHEEGFSARLPKSK